MWVWAWLVRGGVIWEQGPSSGEDRIGAELWEGGAGDSGRVQEGPTGAHLPLAAVICSPVTAAFCGACFELKMYEGRK